MSRTAITRPSPPSSPASSSGSGRASSTRPTTVAGPTRSTACTDIAPRGGIWTSRSSWDCPPAHPSTRPATSSWWPGSSHAALRWASPDVIGAAVNPWTWTGRNPYFETAFQVLDLDPTVDRATARTRIAARRKRISYDATRFPLFGATLSAADVNAAEEQIATLAGRIAAELITHPREAE